MLQLVTLAQASYSFTHTKSFRDNTLTQQKF
jgi:hypothetical protein